MLPDNQDWGAVSVGFTVEPLGPSGRLRIGRGQNVYHINFECRMQALRWEYFTSGSAAIAHRSIEGGVRMDVTAAGDVAIHQSKPCFR